MELLTNLSSLVVEGFHQLMGLFTNLPHQLNLWCAQLGGWVYLLVFLIVFAETGLVVTPILPGDSLLFALGALAATEGAVLNVWVLAGLLLVAAILGDAVNYTIGRKFAAKVFREKNARFFNPAHIERTNAFFTKYGGKTIILARFVPIVRTYAPFVAGMGQMKYSYFAFYNVIGALCWIPSFLFAGYFFGNIPTVKTNFHIVILGIIIVSILPAVIEFWRAHRKATTNEKVL